MRIHWKSEPCAGHALLALNKDHACVQAVADIARLRVGDILEGARSSIRAISPVRLPGQDMSLGWMCSVHGSFESGAEEVMPRREGFSLGWITLSDKGSRGEREDKSGPAIRDTLSSAVKLGFSAGVIIPDDPFVLKATLVDFCLAHCFDMVFTTGGTGVGPRDITPETTLPLLDKRLEGFERMMTAASVAKTPHGMISRAVAGFMGESLVVNLPGSPKAVRENLEVILPAIRHAVEKIQGDSRDCGQ